MRKGVYLGLLFFGVAAISFAAQKHQQREEIKSFELYSWQDAKGGWNFSVFPAVTSAGIAPDVIMGKNFTLKGTVALKDSLAKLPTGSVIYWLDSALGIYKDAKENQLLKYPPGEMIAEIRQYCESRQLKLQVESPKRAERH